ncbi:MAG: dCTP deaminase [Candidatus Lokiarchaeota archaeon]|nr:dCTP deaminase [Candidatus Lokiarchaeota archaeon]
MPLLSDRDLKKVIESKIVRIEPYDPDSVGPCSIDLRLDSVFRTFNPGTPVDIKKPHEAAEYTRLVNTEGDPFMILPGQFVLAQTQERIAISSDYAGLLEGRSSVARLGIIVHAAGLVNPGTGMEEMTKLTLEVYCFNLSPVLLYPGMRIVQLMLVPLSSAAAVGYDERASSRYIGQDSPDMN